MTDAPPTPARAIARAFEGCGKRAALLPYLMGGFPDLETSLEAGRGCAAAGADAIEVGIPFSDPLADGPVIQAAGEQALAAGATFQGLLDCVVAPLSGELPVIVMSYANSLLALGIETAVKQVASAGGSGLIVPDMPAREAGELREICDSASVDLIPLVAPTTPPDEVARIAAGARGFIYVVSVTGVTGERSGVPGALAEMVGRVRALAQVPVAVGFGVATAEQAAEIGELADGVIVGSRLVRALADASTAGEGVAEVERIVAEMAAALA